MTVYIRVLRARADQAVTSAVSYAALLICETVIQGTLLVGVSHLVPPSDTDPRNLILSGHLIIVLYKALLMTAAMLESKRYSLFLNFSSN